MPSSQIVASSAVHTASAMSEAGKKGHANAILAAQTRGGGGRPGAVGRQAHPGREAGGGGHRRGQAAPDGYRRQCHAAGRTPHAGSRRGGRGAPRPNGADASAEAAGRGASDRAAMAAGASGCHTIICVRLLGAAQGGDAFAPGLGMAARRHPHGPRRRAATGPSSASRSAMPGSGRSAPGKPAPCLDGRRFGLRAAC